MRKFKSFLILMILSTTLLWGGNLEVEKYFDSNLIEELISKGNLKNIQSDFDAEPILMPNTEYSDFLKARGIKKNKKNFPFTTESLYYLPKKEIAALSGSKREDFGIKELSIAFRSLSKMEGIRYYSINRHKEEVLYKAAYMVDDPEKLNKIPDPIEFETAEGLKTYMYQQDASFGKNVYQLEYKENQNIVCVSFVNCSSMGFGPFRALEPGKMHIALLGIDCGEGLLIYLQTDSDCNKFPGMAKAMENSLTSRMDALLKWVIQQL